MATDDGTVLVVEVDTGKEVLAYQPRRQGQRDRLQSRWPVFGHRERRRYSKHSYCDRGSYGQGGLASEAGRQGRRHRLQPRWALGGRWRGRWWGRCRRHWLRQRAEFGGGRSMFRTLQPRSITAVAFSPDGGSIATGRHGLHHARLFRLDSGAEAMAVYAPG